MRHSMSPSTRRAPRRDARARRSGQALLLAVLLMVFAALIGSTFITVVALNMDQTAAGEQRQAAANAAEAGMKAIGYQIEANGTSWRPEHISPPPAPRDPEYSYYYTAQDIARGYARTTAHPYFTDWDNDGIFYTDANPDYDDDWLALEDAKATSGASAFVKFPDPRLEQFTGSHSYMADVSIARNSDGDKEGMLRITAVGLSANDPNIFVKKVGYQGTPQNNGPFAWNLFCTNWDYQKTTPGVLSAKLGAAAAVGDNTLTVNSTAGFEPGRLITIQKGDVTTGGVFEQQIISEVSSSTQIRLKGTLANSYSIVAPVPTIRLVNSLVNDPTGSNDTTLPRLFDADTFGGTAQPQDDILMQIRPVTAGFLSNSDVTFRGKSQYGWLASSKLLAAGLVISNPTIAQATLYDGATYNMPASVGAGQIGSFAPTAPQSRVKDNPNSGGDVEVPLTPGRDVTPLTPPDLANFSILLEKTKYQVGGFYGWGPGLYINNPDDVEKVYDNGALRALKVYEMHRLWEGKSFKGTGTGSGNAGTPDATGGIPNGAINHRLSFPRLGNPTNTPPANVIDAYTYPLDVKDANFSLEQKGIRGWVSPSEYRARGTEIVFNGDSALVTLEDRSETARNVPDSTKSWRMPDGSLLPAPLGDKTYSMQMDYPGITMTRTFGGGTPVTTNQKFNGVIYTEGNVRVRGLIGNKDITIVSMGNIYIEGNLTRGGTGRVALLARKNVVLNPTQFVARVRGAQDRDIADRVANKDTAVPATITNVSPGSAIQVLTVNSPNSITIASSTTPDPLGPLAPFRVGDYVRIGNDPMWHVVSGLDTTTNALLFATNVTGVNTGDRVRLLSDPRIESGINVNLFPAVTGAPPTGAPAGVVDERRIPEWFYRIADNADGDTLARDVRLDGITTSDTYGISTMGAGEYRPGVSLEWQQAPSPPPGLTNLPSDYDVRVKDTGDTQQKFSITGATPFDVTPGLPLNDVVSPAGYSGDAVETLEAWRTALDGHQSTVGNPNKWRLYYGAFTPPTYSGHPEPNFAPQTVGDWNRIPARFMARWVPTTALGNPYGLIDTVVKSGRDYGEAARLPLSVSAAISWIPSSVTTTDLHPFTDPASGSTLKKIIGSAWHPTDSALLPTATYDVALFNTDDVESSRADFYCYETATDTLRQQWTRPLSYSLGVPNLTSTAGYNNVVMISRNPVADNDTDADRAMLPPLRLAGLVKVEKDDFSPPGSGTRNYNPIEVKVEATVFAQEGSWFVVPAYTQYNPDLDHNGGVSADEEGLATQMRRLNYKVRFIGTITQNFTPLVETDYDDEESPYELNTSAIYSRGPVGEWMDAAAFPSRIGNAGTKGLGQQWQSVSYEFDTTLVPTKGLLPYNTTLLLPPSPDVSYAG